MVELGMEGAAAVAMERSERCGEGEGFEGGGKGRQESRRTREWVVACVSRPDLLLTPFSPPGMGFGLALVRVNSRRTFLIGVNYFILISGV